MNKRIDELAHGCYEYIEGTLDGDIIEFDYKKFAELIVRECVDYYRSQVGETSEPHTRTLEHFGVE